MTQRLNPQVLISAGSRLSDLQRMVRETTRHPNQGETMVRSIVETLRVEGYLVSEEGVRRSVQRVLNR